LWGKYQSLLVLPNGVVRAIKRQQRIAEIVERSDVARFKRKRSLEMLDGFTGTMLGLQDNTEMGMRGRKIAVNGERLLKGQRCIRQIVCLQVSKTDVIQTAHLHGRARWGRYRRRRRDTL
jgi:hypothetical protein